MKGIRVQGIVPLHRPNLRGGVRAGRTEISHRDDFHSVDDGPHDGGRHRTVRRWMRQARPAIEDQIADGIDGFVVVRAVRNSAHRTTVVRRFVRRPRTADEDQSPLPAWGIRRRALCGCRVSRSDRCEYAIGVYARTGTERGHRRTGDGGTEGDAEARSTESRRAGEARSTESRRAEEK